MDLPQGLASKLGRRANELYAAAQFASAPEIRRAAELVDAARTVAVGHGIAGVEGFLAAVERLGSPADVAARAAIRAAIDEAVEQAALAAWTGRATQMHAA